MSYFWILLMPYTTLAFGIHGGEFITNVNRQLRNLLCAIPFALVAYTVTSTHYDFPVAALAFIAAYGGVNIGFDSASLPGGQPKALWLAFKGLVTFPPLGAVLLPLAYLVGYKTRWTNVLAEYLSGALYGLVLLLIIIGGR